MIRARKEYLLICDDEHDRDAWLHALRHNSSQPPMAGLSGDEGTVQVDKQRKRTMLNAIRLPSRKWRAWCPCSARWLSMLSAAWMRRLGLCVLS